MTANESDRVYREALTAVPHALQSAFEQLTAQGPVELEGLNLTEALLRRMTAFYDAQSGVDALLGKKLRSAAADFFVESVAFYLKALVVTHRLDAEVSVERRLERCRGTMRPDISLWRGDRCVACIECKTQLGWSRGRWEAQFLERERRLLELFAGAPSFLLVLTGLNWPGFGSHPELGKKYFLILKDVWPTNVDFSQLEKTVCTPIELLLSQIAAAVRRDVPAGPEVQTHSNPSV